jgi:hypothetical protein
MSAIDECAGAVDLSRDDWEHLIDQYIIGRNAERNRNLIKRRLLDGICYEPLSEEFDLSVRQTKKIVYAAEKELIKRIHP